MIFIRSGIEKNKMNRDKKRKIKEGGGGGNFDDVDTVWHEHDGMASLWYEIPTMEAKM